MDGISDTLKDTFTKLSFLTRFVSLGDVLKLFENCLSFDVLTTHFTTTTTTYFTLIYLQILAK